jgi:hypothetical protein
MLKRLTKGIPTFHSRSSTFDFPIIEHVREELAVLQKGLCHRV